jgi:hypothetical protein
MWKRMWSLVLRWLLRLLLKSLLPIELGPSCHALLLCVLFPSCHALLLCVARGAAARLLLWRRRRRQRRRRRRRRRDGVEHHIHVSGEPSSPQGIAHLQPASPSQLVRLRGEQRPCEQRPP